MDEEAGHDGVDSEEEEGAENEEEDEEEDEEEIEKEEELEAPEIPDLEIDPPPPEDGIDTAYLGHVVKKRRTLEGRSLHEGNNFTSIC
jgi:hypothetical protein